MSDPSQAKPGNDEAEAAVRTLLAWIGEDTGRAGLARTPARVLASWDDWFAGYRMDPYALLGQSFQPVRDYRRIVALCDIDFASHCEHHIAPFLGRIHVAYVPNERLAGVSKLVRVVDAFTKRLQVQERLTAEIADCIEKTLEPRGVAVVVEARHQCMTTRGVNQKRIRMVTEELRGVFESDANIHAEFLRKIDNCTD